MLNALSGEAGFPVAVASAAVSIFFFTSGIGGLGIAVLLERFDVRYTIAAGTILAGTSLAAIGHVTSEWQLYLVYTLFGVGFGASSLLPATTLVTRWFRKSRALALSVASTGLSMGGVTITPVSAIVIDSIGITAASPILGAIYIVGILPISLMVLRSQPEDMGLAADGEPQTSESNAKYDGIVFTEALKQRYFWALGISYVFIMMAQVGGIAHQYGMVSEHLEGKAAAMALAVLPLFSIIGRLAGGMIIDRISAWRFALVMMLVQALSLAGLGAGINTWFVLVNLALFGITTGNLLTLQPILIADAYGLIQYSRIYSFSNLLTMIGVALGPGVMGYLYAMDESYGPAYLFAALAGLVAAVIFLAGRPPRS